MTSVSGRIGRRIAGMLAALAFSLSIPSAALASGDPKTLRCTPLWPVFCGNVHVLCSGRSRISTDPFTVSLTGETATVTPDGGNRLR